MWNGTNLGRETLLILFCDYFHKRINELGIAEGILSTFDYKFAICLIDYAFSGAFAS